MPSKSVTATGKRILTHAFFVKSGKSWWESLTPEEKEKKRQMNIKASHKRWGKKRKKAKK